MLKTQVDLKTRDVSKKPKLLLKEKIVPGVVYDQKTKSIPVQITAGELEAFLLDARQGQLVEVTIDSKNPTTAIFKELQKNVRTNKPSHISFMLLDKEREVEMPVRIELVGEAPAVKNSLGVIIQTLNAIELKGLPKDFPEYLEIDVSSLNNVGDSLDMTRVKVPQALKYIREEDKTIPVVTISPFQKEIEEEKPVEAVEGEELVEGEALPEGEAPAEGEVIEGTEGEAPAEGKEVTEKEKPGEEKPAKGQPQK